MTFMNDKKSSLLKRKVSLLQNLLFHNNLYLLFSRGPHFLKNKFIIQEKILILVQKLRYDKSCEICEKIKTFYMRKKNEICNYMKKFGIPRNKSHFMIKITKSCVIFVSKSHFFPPFLNDWVQDLVGNMITQLVQKVNNKRPFNGLRCKRVWQPCSRKFTSWKLYFDQ